MKKLLLTTSLLGLLISFNLVSAQDYVEKTTNNVNGGVSLVVFKENSGLTSASTKGLFKDILNLQPTEELRLLKSEKDFTGKFTDDRYQLYQNNIKVEGGVYILHYKAGKLISMNGEIFRDGKAYSNAGISADAAFLAAVKSVGAQSYMWEDAAYIAQNEYKKPTGELVYMPVSDGAISYRLKLAYKFDIYAAQPISRAYIYVDATSGNILAVDAMMKHAKQET